MQTIIAFLGIILLLFFVYNMIYTYSEIQYVKSDIDDKIYMIRRGNNKSQQFLKESANTLAIINKNIVALIEHLDMNYNHHTNKSYFIKKLKDNYKPYIMSEAAVDPRYTTYTIDKKDMHICLRTRDNHEQIYDLNLLMYVILHELAHLCNYDQYGNPILGHGKEFKYIFRFLVEESMKINIYTHTNYAMAPKEYCGIMITSSII